MTVAKRLPAERAPITTTGGTDHSESEHEYPASRGFGGEKQRTAKSAVRLTWVNEPYAGRKQVDKSQHDLKASRVNEMPSTPISGDSRLITSRQLTTCTVVEGGKAIRLHLIGQGGEQVSIELPFDQAESIVMTLPRLLSAALKARTGDVDTRYVFSAERWSLEKAKNESYRIFTVLMQGGFEVAFAIPFETCLEMGTALTRRSETASNDGSPKKPIGLN
ncbi:hypothetical protein [Bradyrhizobium cenepequi]